MSAGSDGFSGLSSLKGFSGEIRQASSYRIALAKGYCVAAAQSSAISIDYDFCWQPCSVEAQAARRAQLKTAQRLAISRSRSNLDRAKREPAAPKSRETKG